MAETYPLPTVNDDRGTWGPKLNNYLTYMKPYYSVKNYGATGDGSTDDTTAIQAAIDEAAGDDDIGGPIVYFPSGTYMVSNLTVPYVTKLIGNSMHDTTIKAIAGTTGNIIEDTGSASKIVIQELLINGNDQNVVGLNLGNNTTQMGTYSWIDRVRIARCTTGADLDINAGGIGDLTIDNFLTDGLVLRGAANWIYSLALVGITADTPEKGLHLLSQGTRIYSLHCEGDFDNPLYIANSYNTIDHYYLSIGTNVTVTDGVYITSTKIGNSIDDCYVNLSKSGSALTNFVTDAYLDESIAWVGSSGAGTYKQGARNDYNVINITGDLTIPSTGELHCVVADGLSSNATVTLPRLSGSLRQQITVVNADDTYEVLLQKSASDSAIYVAGNTSSIYIPPRRSLTIRCNLTEWSYVAGDVGRANAFVTLADDATPTVRGGVLFLTGGTTTITDFDDGVTGQTITVIAEHSVTITDGTNIFLSGSSNFEMTATDTLTLIQKADGKWYEVSRSDSGA